MTGTPEDEAAIRSLFELQGEAWKAADAERFASAFAEDADFINIRAHTLRGREEIARHLPRSSIPSIEAPQSRWANCVSAS